MKRGLYKPPKPKTEEEDEAPPPKDCFEFLKRHFSAAFSARFADRQTQLWNWVETLARNVRSRPFAAIWPRGSGKSTTTETAVVYLGTKLSRRCVLYVCGTQQQANLHVDAIAAGFERIGVGRLLSKYGQSRGWTRSLLRTEHGFNVIAVGLDVGLRGIKLDDLRPDLIVLDDVDDEDDSSDTIAKKIRRLTRSILPSGSTDCTVLFVQNLVHEQSVMSRIVSGKADFLLDIEISGPFPAVIGLHVERVTGGDGRRTFRIIAGEATWEGQSIEICEKQINDYGYEGFLRECQQEVKGAGGIFFHQERLQYLNSLDDLPEIKDKPDDPECKPRKIKLLQFARTWDFGATEGGGDFSAGLLGAKGEDGRIYVLDLFHEQYGSDRVRSAVFDLADSDRRTYGAVTVIIPQDPAAAGKAQAEQLQLRLQQAGHDVKVVVVAGKKAIRARTWQEYINRSDVVLLRGAWNEEFAEEHRLFREDESHDHDDIVDTGADLANEFVYSGWATTAQGLESFFKWAADRS